MEAELFKFLSEYGILGILLLAVLTGQLVPKIYYNRLLEENKELQQSLEKSMDLNKTQSDMIATYKQLDGGARNDK